MDNFEDVLNQHKEKARKVYAESGESNLINSALREIEGNCADYEYYFQMGQQSKQKRIDELQARYDELNDRASQIAWDQMTTAQHNYQLEQKIDELQVRVDAAQKLIQQWRDVETYSDDCANELEQALKGGEV